jgi:hypothetical protein
VKDNEKTEININIRKAHTGLTVTLSENISVKNGSTFARSQPDTKVDANLKNKENCSVCSCPTGVTNIPIGTLSAIAQKSVAMLSGQALLSIQKHRNKKTRSTTTAIPASRRFAGPICDSHAKRPVRAGFIGVLSFDFDCKRALSQGDSEDRALSWAADRQSATGAVPSLATEASMHP